jgi:hypothetical protein
VRRAQHLRAIGVAISLAAGLSLPSFGVTLPLPEWAQRPMQPRAASAIIDGSGNTVRNIGSPLPLDGSGRVIGVTGHVVCSPPGEVVAIQVTLVQAATGAVAVGQAQALCTGARSTWSTQAVAVSPVGFLPGTAQACAVATGPTTLTHWCRAGGATLIAGGLIGSSPLLVPPLLPPPIVPPPPLPIVMPGLAPLGPWGGSPGPAIEPPAVLPGVATATPPATATPIAGEP